MKRLGLGTVQFGMDYGINNKRGRIPKKEVFEILDFAAYSGINLLDTAQTYGESEKIIGEYFSKSNARKFNIVSKFPSWDELKLEEIISSSLKALRINSFYGYLFHDFKSYLQNHKLLGLLKTYKKKGLIKKIGFSLYRPKELDFLLKNKTTFDIIQVPYNILDQRFEEYFPVLKKSGIEIHVRSVFLQGLLLKKSSQLPSQFIKIKSNIRTLEKLSTENSIPPAAICLNFVLANPYVDKTIIGVDSLGNLKQNVSALKYGKNIKKIYEALKSLRISDENIILPTNWNK